MNAKQLLESMTACSSSTTTATAPTGADIRAMQVVLAKMEEQQRSITADFKTWMLKQNADPDKGALLVMPGFRRNELPFWPSFVRFSYMIHAPCLIKPPIQGI